MGQLPANSMDFYIDPHEPWARVASVIDKFGKEDYHVE